jgi:hypothetical protein
LDAWREQYLYESRLSLSIFGYMLISTTRCGNQVGEGERHCERVPLRVQGESGRFEW